jgi:hypothetical protein
MARPKNCSSRRYLEAPRSAGKQNRAELTEVGWQTDGTVSPWSLPLSRRFESEKRKRGWTKTVLKCVLVCRIEAPSRPGPRRESLTPALVCVALLPNHDMNDIEGVSAQLFALF